MLQFAVVRMRTRNITQGQSIRFQRITGKRKHHVNYSFSNLRRSNVFASVLRSPLGGKLVPVVLSEEDRSVTRERSAAEAWYFFAGKRRGGSRLASRGESRRGANDGGKKNSSELHGFYKGFCDATICCRSSCSSSRRSWKSHGRSGSVRTSSDVIRYSKRNKSKAVLGIHLHGLDAHNKQIRTILKLCGLT